MCASVLTTFQLLLSPLNISTSKNVPPRNGECRGEAPAKMTNTFLSNFKLYCGKTSVIIEPNFNPFFGSESATAEIDFGNNSKKPCGGSPTGIESGLPY